MKKILICFLIFTVHPIFAAFNEPRFEGINLAWAGTETANSLWDQADTIKKALKIIPQFLPDNPMVFEVGAYNGNESVILAKLWPNGTIISFEANPSQFAKYQEKAVNFTNMHGYNLAVNTYNGTAEFYLCWGTNGLDPIYEGASSVLPAAESMKIHYMGPKIEVPCVILDDWCLHNQISSFDFIWLDLEGFELPFLKSSPNILNTIKVIYTETNFYPFREGMTQYADLKSFLESQGFTMIAHWYNEGLQGDAIFVRNELVR